MPHPNSYGERDYIAYLGNGAAPIMLRSKSTEAVFHRLLNEVPGVAVLRSVPLEDRRRPKRKYFKTAALPEGLRVGLACSGDAKVEGV